MQAKYLGEWRFVGPHGRSQEHVVAMGEPRLPADNMWYFDTKEAAEGFERRYNAGDTTIPDDAHRAPASVQRRPQNA